METEELGGYRLIEQLGSGGMGVVYLGVDGGKSPVAVKVLHPHISSDDSARRRLAREVRTLRRIKHPRIAEVLDAELDSDRPFIVTEFVDGTTLSADVRVNGPFAEDELVHFGHALLDALGAVHSSGVIHRDLKPANVMIMDGEPMVIDFGIAQAADEVKVTATGLVMGTPGYLSPEIADGKASSEKTDWWGWAATMVFAATGRNPYGSGPLEAVLGRVAMGKVDLDGVPERFVPLLRACLEPKPERRPSGAMILQALVDIESGRVPELGGGTQAQIPQPGDMAGRSAGFAGAAGALGGAAGALGGAGIAGAMGAGAPGAYAHSAGESMGQPRHQGAEHPGSGPPGYGAAHPDYGAAHPGPQHGGAPGAHPYVTPAHPAAPGGRAAANAYPAAQAGYPAGPGGTQVYAAVPEHPGGGLPAGMQPGAANALQPTAASGERPYGALTLSERDRHQEAPYQQYQQHPGGQGEMVGYGPQAQGPAGHGAAEAGRRGGWLMLALNILAIVLAALGPFVIVGLACAWQVIARATGRIVLARRRKAVMYGPQAVSGWSSAAKAPGALVASVFSSVLCLILPVVAAVAAAVLVRLDVLGVVPAGMSAEWSLWAAASVFGLVLWLGPGSANLRRGSRAIIAPAVRTARREWIWSGAFLVLAGLALSTVLGGAATLWWPAPGSLFEYLPEPGAIG